MPLSDLQTRWLSDGPDPGRGPAGAGEPNQLEAALRQAGAVE